MKEETKTTKQVKVSWRWGEGWLLDRKEKKETDGGNCNKHTDETQWSVPTYVWKDTHERITGIWTTEEKALQWKDTKSSSGCFQAKKISLLSGDFRKFVSLLKAANIGLCVNLELKDGQVFWNNPEEAMYPFC